MLAMATCPQTTLSLAPSIVESKPWSVCANRKDSLTGGQHSARNFNFNFVRFLMFSRTGHHFESFDGERDSLVYL